MSAPSPLPSAFLVIKDDLLSKVGVTLGPFAVNVVKNDRFAETRRLGKAHISRNESLEDLRAAVARAKGKVVLEASGGVTLETVRVIAETGVDVISVGALTHSAPVLDIGLDAD